MKTVRLLETDLQTPIFTVHQSDRPIRDDQADLSDVCQCWKQENNDTHGLHNNYTLHC